MSGFDAFCRAVVVGFVILSGASFAQTASSLQKWEGYYPTKYANTLPLPAGQTFWDDPIVKTALAAALPPEQLKQLKSCWGASCTEDRIQLYDDMIAVHVCKKDSRNFRACQQWAAYVFVEMDSGRASVCWNMMVPGDLDPEPASLWYWHSPSGASGSAAVDVCTSGSAYQYAESQKQGRPVGNQIKGLAVPKLKP